MNSQTYNREFYEGLRINNGHSAKFLAEYLVRKLNFSSVIDIGCGNGDLLFSFFQMGVKNLKGIEGNENYITEKNPFSISISNLEEPIISPIRYELAVCLEVAEHLEEKFADNLILTITSASDLVVFSAAIPGQGGTNHVNEQAPLYWATKFFERGYTLFLDPRHEIWKRKDIAAYYRQNILVYRKCFEPNPIFVEPKFMRHPEIFLSPLRRLYRLFIRIFRKIGTSK